MTIYRTRISGAEAYDLIFPEHLSMLSKMDQETMHRALHNSSALWIGFADSDVFCIMGTIPPTLLSDCAYLWFYTTKHFPKHSRTVARWSRGCVAEALDLYPTLVGHCALGADKSIRWLKWLGAVFTDPLDKAIPFEIRAR